MEEDREEVYRLKYYDGMGKDVTDYVTKLEARIKELELAATTPEAPKPLPKVDVGIMEDAPKPTRKARKAANTE
jgi:hypothetical protein